MNGEHSAVDWNAIPPLILGLMSIVCLMCWASCTFGYLQAVPFVLLGAFFGLGGVYRAKRRFAAATSFLEQAKAAFGGAISCLGLCGNVGLFTIALVDM